MHIKEILADVIKKALLHNGLQKKEFAKLMGVQPSIVTRWLSGSHNMTSDTLWAISQKLNIQIKFMLPVDFEGTNLVLNKPSDMTDEQCMPIRAFKGVTTDKFPIIRTKWMPSKEDIDAINSGRGIWLDVLSNSFPPVAVFTEDANGNINE